jgi:hypothetical protein
MVGQFSKLDSFTAAVVGVVEDELDELQAVSVIAPAANTDSTPAGPRRRDLRRRVVSDESVSWRVDMGLCSFRKGFSG